MFSLVVMAIKNAIERRRNSLSSRKEFEARRLVKFRRLVKYASRHSLYYSKVIKEHGINCETCVPEDFPVLTKKNLIANFDDIVTDRRVNKAMLNDFLTHSKDPNELLLGKYHVVHTSGSSGEVSYFLYSNKEWFSGGGQSRRGPNINLRKERKLRGNRGRVRFAFYGATGGHFTGVSLASSFQRWPFNMLFNTLVLEINLPLAETLRSLNDFQPEMMFGYATAVKILAEKQRQGELNIKPIAIVTSGETLSQSNWQYISETFNCQVANGYGCTEHLMMGSSTSDNSKIILYDANLIFEFNEDHTLVTNLFNYTLPLIRYYMNDVLRPLPADPDYSPYQVIDNIVGRSENAPVFINESGEEDFISPHTINEIFIAGIDRFQMVLESKHSFTFKVCINPNLNEEEKQKSMDNLHARLKEILAQKNMANVNFTILPVSELPVDPRTRKFKLIVDNKNS